MMRLSKALISARTQETNITLPSSKKEMDLHLQNRMMALAHHLMKPSKTAVVKKRRASSCPSLGAATLSAKSMTYC
jgi:hypothetical protein